MQQRKIPQRGRASERKPSFMEGACERGGERASDERRKGRLLQLVGRPNRRSRHAARPLSPFPPLPLSLSLSLPRTRHTWSESTPHRTSLPPSLLRCRRGVSNPIHAAAALRRPTRPGESPRLPRLDERRRAMRRPISAPRAREAKAYFAVAAGHGGRRGGVGCPPSLPPLSLSSPLPLRPTPPLLSSSCGRGRLATKEIILRAVEAWAHLVA